MPILRTTAGSLLVNSVLPPEMVDHGRVLDKKGLSDILRQIATDHPDKYREISKRLADVGRSVAQQFGGYSFGLAHLRTAKAAHQIRGELGPKIDTILDDDNLTDDERHSGIVKLVGAAMEKQPGAVYDESLAEKNPLAYQVLSGSRGNKVNLASLRGSDLLYMDHRNRVIPMPILHSYSEGLNPAEYWAATYGARKSVIDTKMAVAKAGYYGKMLNRAAHRLVVVDHDGEDEVDENGKKIERPLRGYPVDADDRHNEGALLASEFGGYPRHTVLTSKILKDLKSRGVHRLLVRSPTVGSPPGGGVYSRDVGIQERGGLPGRGEEVGLTAAQSLSEPVSQAQLGSKHSAGVAGQSKAVSGFDYLNALVQTPASFKDWAAHADHDGRVQSIAAAPAGGSNIIINDQPHYVRPDTAIKVRPGDEVEAGDVLSDGIPDPSIITKHKGVGEGRRYWVNAMRKAMTDVGLKGHRRNLELVARGLIDHVRMTDETDLHVPDDVVPYSTLEHVYKPRPGFSAVEPKKAVGKYLESPILHYTIGTKIRPSVVRELQDFGVKTVDVHHDPPPFEPEMIRGAETLRHDPDWMTRMYGSHLKGGLLESVQRGGVSDEQSTSFVPSLARAVDFGLQGAVRPPEPPVAAESIGKPTSNWKGMFGLSRKAAALRRVKEGATQRLTDTTVKPNTGTSTHGEGSPSAGAASVAGPSASAGAASVPHVSVPAPSPRAEMPTFHPRTPQAPAPSQFSGLLESGGNNRFLQGYAPYQAARQLFGGGAPQEQSQSPMRSPQQPPQQPPQVEPDPTDYLHAFRDQAMPFWSQAPQQPNLPDAVRNTFMPFWDPSQQRQETPAAPNPWLDIAAQQAASHSFQNIGRGAQMLGASRLAGAAGLGSKAVGFTPMQLAGDLWGTGKAYSAGQGSAYAAAHAQNLTGNPVTAALSPWQPFSNASLIGQTVAEGNAAAAETAESARDMRAKRISGDPLRTPSADLGGGAAGNAYQVPQQPAQSSPQLHDLVRELGSSSRSAQDKINMINAVPADQRAAVRDQLQAMVGDRYDRLFDAAPVFEKRPVTSRRDPQSLTDFYGDRLYDTGMAREDYRQDNKKTQNEKWRRGFWDEHEMSPIAKKHQRWLEAGSPSTFTDPASGQPYTQDEYTRYQAFLRRRAASAAQDPNNLMSGFNEFKNLGLKWYNPADVLAYNLM